MATLTFPLSCWIGLVASGAEVAGHGYVRQPATLAMDVEGDEYCNLCRVQWPVASGVWGTIDTVQIWDSGTAGNLLGTLPTITPVSIAMYERPRIPPSGIRVVNVRSPYGFGTGTFGIGRYTTRDGLQGIGTGIGSPYDIGGYGAGPYEAMTLGVLLQKTFAPVLMCGGRPGDWAPALTGCCT